MPGSAPPTMPSSTQRSFFLTNFFTALRQQTSGGGGPPSLSSPAAAAVVPPQQPNKYYPGQPSSTATATAQQTSASTTTTAQPIPSHSSSPSPGPGSPPPSRMPPLTSPRQAIPIPNNNGRRRGSDSSSEGFRDVLGADKWYIGGRTAGGDEKFFKLGVVRRVRSGDRLSLDRLSL